MRRRALVQALVAAVGHWLLLDAVGGSPPDVDGENWSRGLKQAAKQHGGVTCGSDEIRCDDGRCIPLWKCQAGRLCEELCTNSSTCHSNQFECAHTKKCIPTGWVCDGDPDCGVHDILGIDSSDENPTKCKHDVHCNPNEQMCDDTTCIPTEQFCNGVINCPDSSDEFDFCTSRNGTGCEAGKCVHGCTQTRTSAVCYCPPGEMPHESKCQDLDECLHQGSCDQQCHNTIGSFTCACNEGYRLVDSTHCKAINDPVTEEPSLIFSTQRDIQRARMDGTPWPGNSTIKLINSHALEFNFANRSVCYIHNKVTKSSLSCSNVDDLNDRWLLPGPAMFPELESIHQIALDWVSGNWYFLDEFREVIIICNATLDACDTLLELDLSKPRGIALDPTRGVMFFTKWGHSAPQLERCQLDGKNRTTIVSEKIVYPYGVAVDIPNSVVYWVDTYLDFVERVDYSGHNRKTIKKGFPVQNLYSVSVFENDLLVTSWQSQSIIRLNLKQKTVEHSVIVANISRPYSVHVFHKQRQPDVNHPCQVHNGQCDHICIPKYGEKGRNPYVKCLCKPGHRLLAGTRGQCVLVNHTAFLIYGKGRPAMVKAIAFSPEDPYQAMVPITDVSQPTALDYDYKDGYIYFSDVQRHIIQRQHLDGTGREVILSATDPEGPIGNCEGLAVDWLGRNFYWTDETRNTISAAPLANFTLRRTLVSAVIANPRAIVLHPTKGMMFWTEWAGQFSESGKIGCAWMDGTHVSPLVTSDLHWPNGLSIDYMQEKLYWCDVFLDKIESYDMLSTARTTILDKDHGHPAHPYGLVYHAGHLFWTEFESGGVQRYNLVNGTLSTLSKESPALYEIKVYNHFTQSDSNACSQNKCLQMCLATPKGAVCACADNLILDASGKVCVTSPDNTTASPLCAPGFFHCKHNDCIDKSYICDGDDDCGDGSDEDITAGGICENIVCNQEQYRCDSNRCIHNHWVCDGDKDCEDGNDESPDHCRTSTCTSLQFTCKTSGRCIPLAWKCDSDADCGDGDTSDEDGNCKYSACLPTEFTCDNKNCISTDNYCDGHNDCKDNSDESNCAEVCNPSTTIFCVPQDRCYPLKSRCDGTVDCPDGSDENNCPPRPAPSHNNRHHNIHNDKKETAYCEVNEFQCRNLECIRKEFRCDSRVDCMDGSDEVGCGAMASTPPPSSSPAPPLVCELPLHFCIGPERPHCLSPERLCDGVNDCIDGSDEGLRCEEQLCFRNSECSHLCHNAPWGLTCSCGPGMQLQANGRSCSEAHPCSQWGACSQQCQPLKARHKCVCLPGYRLADDGFTCKSTDGAIPYVIFSNRHELRGIDLQTMQAKPLISSLKNTIALDFFYTPAANMLFWTDVIDDKIYRGTMIGGSLSNIEVVVQSGLSTAEGLAVDWIAQNLYWVESNLDQVEVARLNGSFRRTLVAGDMESPRAIVVDPRDGFVFWTDWEVGAPRIERCTLAGRARTVVVRVDQVTDGAWPNGLTLDYAARRIYWVDARSDSVHTTTYEGKEHHEVVRGHETLSHPFAIALFENHVYWTDWRTNSLIRANKWNGSDIHVLQRTYAQPFDITIMHPSRQPTDGVNPCGNNNGNCSHLCLLDGPTTYQCACPHVMRLGMDLHTCVVNEKVLLFSRPNEVRGVDLFMPYYHTIPTISLPQVLAPQQLDFVASADTIYWADTQLSVIKKTGLTTGPSTGIVDTGIESPAGLAVDWISHLMFYSSSGSTEHISVCNLRGEYTAVLISSPSLHNVTSLAVDPNRGRLFWSHSKDGLSMIEASYMDGTARAELVSQATNKDLTTPLSLCMDSELYRLYWVNVHSSTIQYFDFTNKKVYKVPIPVKSEPTAVVPYFDQMYYASGHDQAIHVCNKTDCHDDRVLRNNTANVLSIRIYDAALQKGNNSCGNGGGCQQLCLPTGTYTRTCACATGYHPDPTHPNRCQAIEELMLFSINWEIRGLSLDGDSSRAVLGPISQVSMATSIDFHADKNFIYWADSDHATLNRICRDGTGRQVLVEQTEPADTLSMDWVTGLALDWIAGNMYWSDPKRNAIEVARLNGSSRYVVVANDIVSPSALAVDPVRGYLFIAGTGWVMRCGLDGSHRSLLYNLTTAAAISDITLDYDAQKVYWTDTARHAIMSMNYDGSSQTEIHNQSLGNPYALTVHENYIYWVDTISDGGSIKKAPVSNMSNFQVLARNIGDSLKDIQIISKKRQRGTNPCGVQNGGCAKLCLFDGEKAVCACPHGQVADDGKSCVPYDAFLMYSRVVKIDSIHMFDKTDLNAPYPTIQNKEMMRNAIGLSFDYANQRLFYSDIQRGSINTVFFNGSNHQIIVDKQGSVEGLAFDPSSSFLYWTCNNEARINKMNITEALELSQLLGAEGNKEHPGLVQHIIKLDPSDKPRGIAVDSCLMIVFWTNWNSHAPSIQRAYGNGFNMQSIITTDIHMPNALTLDQAAQKLYWADARLDKIERADYDGKRRVVITQDTPAHPFDIAVFGEYIFWTDWVLHAIVRANKYTGLNVVRLRRDVPRPMGIVAVANNTDNCMSNPCLVVNGGCEDLCHLDMFGNRECSCHPGRFLDADGSRCIAVNMVPCSDRLMFHCSNLGCIPYEATCDGIAHCPDESDEDVNYCATRICPEEFWRCQNNRCIRTELFCNHVNDCGDSSDEENCSCGSDMFRCKSGQCIIDSLKCDMTADCPDASDEMGCPKTNCLVTGAGRGRTVPDSRPLLQCNHTTPCLHPAWVCDGYNDCLDNSDEINCTDTATLPPPGSCNPSMFKCVHGMCVPAQFRCDGEDDCNDGEEFDNGISSDERDCERPCTSEQFVCANKECIPATWQCDGHQDCADGSDESEHCSARTCTEKQFKCSATSPRCIQRTWLCDGENDCEGGEDEGAAAGCEVAPCQPHHLQCASGTCVPKQHYCDGDQDCPDNSDEPEGCHSGLDEADGVCGEGRMACKSGGCVLQRWACDTWNDCKDGSDEAPELCNKTVEPGACLSPDHECANGVCVTVAQLCDGKNDCGDYSDETKCNVNECLDATLCAHVCTDMKVGYACSCKRGYRVSPHDKHLCVDLDECEDNPCGQVCRNTQGSFVCSCQDGFTLQPDKINCHAASRTPAALIFSNRYYIRTLNLANEQMSLLAHNLTNAVALDFDWAGQCIYWTDVTRHGSNIKRLCGVNATITVNSTYQVLHSSNLQNPDGMAVDWVGRNLYWCDKGLDTIEVSRLDGRHRKVLLNSNLQEPRAIALDPKHGMMYWTDWGEHAHIGRADMDGSNPHVIINSSLGWPNALAIAHESRELYFADAKEDYVAVADLDGRNVRFLFSKAKNPMANLHHIFALAIWEGNIYWSDWETKTIERCRRHALPRHTSKAAAANGTEHAHSPCRSIAQLIHKPMDIRIYHPYRQRPVPDRSLKCAALNCTGLCLLNSKEVAKCACPESFTLDTDGRTCLPACNSAHFLCERALKCIPFWWRCDTQDDCGDGSDEPESCPPFKCTPGHYQCKNTHCIHPSQICNGKDDCGDSSDEVDCNNFSCLSSQFKCKGDNATTTDFCIPIVQRCDGKQDCPGGNDELDCPPFQCTDKQFTCKNLKCIPKVWVCDRDDDCGDNSDETEICNERVCPSDHFRCSSGRCIPLRWKCDLDNDCPGGEDEGEECSQRKPYTCEPSYFRCKNNRCIPGRFHCDYDNDCGDNSDEEHCLPRNCSESEFRCMDGRCIRGSLRCNSEFNCEDRSDEQNCDTTCKEGEFRCLNPHYCIFGDWQCDGDTDCADGSDEVDCKGHHAMKGHGSGACGMGTFACHSTPGHCIPDRWRCDGMNDCNDGSDEQNGMCAKRICPPDSYRCTNNKCITGSNWCDGTDDCGDGSDENHAACKNIGLCGKDEFHCAIGHCISQKFVCDGDDTCGDMSDELECGSNTACAFGACSQLCMEKHTHNITCKCEQGYKPGFREGRETCEAVGPPVKLIVGTDFELRMLSPYKEGTDSYLHLPPYNEYSMTWMKIGPLDLMYGEEMTLVFWYEYRLKGIRIYSFRTQSDQVTDTSQNDGAVVENVLVGLEDLKSLAVEWLSLRLYWVEAKHGGSISAATIKGRMQTTLLKQLGSPEDIVLSAATRQMVYTCIEGTPRIELASLSGTGRRVLAKRGVRWPIAITLDIPAARVYWTDPKTATLESVKLDGTDRHTVYRFKDGVKPYKVAVFEDWAYISTYYHHDVAKLDKLGRSDLNYLVGGMSRISSLKIMHQQMQTMNLTSTCAVDTCDESALCLMTSSSAGHDCLCPDGLIVGGYVLSKGIRCVVGSQVVATCTLRCAGGGSCEAVDGRQHCVCLPGYSGPRCEKFSCDLKCKHDGRCSPSHPGGALKCECSPQWTGELCDIPMSACGGGCLNGGNCTQNGCLCSKDYSGVRCEKCGDGECLHGGACVIDNGPAYCDCVRGWTGRHCEYNVCQNCADPGHCTVLFDGSPNCFCPADQPECHNRLCKGLCRNGGACRPSGAVVVCACPPTFTGPHCEEQLCKPPDCEHKIYPGQFPDRGSKMPEEGACGLKGLPICQNRGFCTITASSNVCLCPKQYGGNYCETYVGHDNACINRCKNRSVCTLAGPGAEPRCHCMEGWRGKLCGFKDPCATMECPGVCRVINEVATCQCDGGYGGLLCDISPEQMAAESRHVWTIAGVSLLLLVIIAASAVFIVFKRRGGKSFSHSRLQDNVEISNPMYMAGGADEDMEPMERGFVLDSDKNGGHFANPVYDSMYAGSAPGGGTSVGGGAASAGTGPADERAGLLQNSDTDPLS